MGNAAVLTDSPASSSAASPGQNQIPAARRPTSIWTWAGIAVVLAVVGIEAFARDSEAVRTLTVTFISIVLESLPFIMIGALVGGVIEVFISREWVARILPRRPFLACMAAGCLGLMLPVCECAVVPITRRLVRKGVPFSAAMTYLLAGPIFNPLVAASTIVAYGWDWHVLVVRMLCGYSIGVFAGYFMGRIYKGHAALVANWAGAEGHSHGHDHDDGCGHDHSGDESHSPFQPAAFSLAPMAVAQDFSQNGAVFQLITPNSSAGILQNTQTAADDACGCGHDHAAPGAGAPPLSLGRKLLAVLDHAGEDFLYVGQFLIIGALVAAVSQTFIPRQFFVTLASTPVAAVLMMMVLAVFLNLCSEADAFVASSFRTVLPLSSQMAFMVLGPMLDFKLTAMYLGFVRKRAFLTLVIIMGIMVLLAMLLFHLSSWEVMP